MAQKLSEVLKIQNEIVRLSSERTSVDGNQLQSIDQRLQAYNVLQVSGGQAPTKRDEIGNVLLYEDPIITGSQLQRADQYISVDLIKPDYDDEQAKEVLDTQINELYIPEDTSQIARLQSQVEELRQQLRDATAPINVIQGGSGTSGTGGGGTNGTGGNGTNGTGGTGFQFPQFALPLPDATGGTKSAKDGTMGLTTAIFNDTTMTLGNFNGANPFSINWWIINKDTEEIYWKGVNDTYIGEIGTNIQGQNPSITKDELQTLFDQNQLDVVLQLTNTPSNFSGWYVNDQSSGQLTNYYKFSPDPIVRFRWTPRFNIGNALIDEARNNYYIAASFLNEAPAVNNNIPVNVNLNVAEIGATGVVSTIGSLGGQALSAEISINETDNSANVIQSISINTPQTVVAYQGNNIRVAAINTRISNKAGNMYEFKGWYVKNAFNNNYNQLTTSRAYNVNLLLEADYNWVAGYQLYDEPDPPSNPPRSCFLAGTNIMLANGTQIPIEAVKVGDLIMSYDFDNSTWSPSSVLELEAPMRNDYYKVELKNGTTLRMTNEHPVYTRGGWASIIPDETKEDSGMNVHELKVGDELLTSTNTWIEVVNITNVPGQVQTYNLKRVDRYNNFFADDVLAHNKEWNEP